MEKVLLKQYLKSSFTTYLIIFMVQLAWLFFFIGIAGAAFYTNEVIGSFILSGLFFIFIRLASPWLMRFVPNKDIKVVLKSAASSLCVVVFTFFFHFFDSIFMVNLDKYKQSSSVIYESLYCRHVNSIFAAMVFYIFIFILIWVTSYFLFFLYFHIKSKKKNLVKRLLLLVIGSIVSPTLLYLFNIAFWAFLLNGCY